MLTTFQIGLLIYFGVINLVTLIIFGVDKISSTSGAWRVRERTLYLFSLLGGTIGALLAIHFFRHKSRKASFLLIIIVILLLQIAALLYSGLIAIPASTIDSLRTSL